VVIEQRELWDVLTAVDEEPAPLEVVVLRSTRRRKTIQAQLVGDVLEVRVPARMSAAEEAEWVDKMRKRFERRRSTERFDVDARARELARRYGLPLPASVRWVDNQTTQWGSCTPADRTIRLSSRMATFPRWVVDYVLVHELAHIAEPNHSPAFHELVSRYPRVERATGFLIAKGMFPDD
jgi:hypothetical protein